MPAKTYLTGLIGAELAGSLSPPLHNAGFAALGVHGLYRPIDIALQNLAAGDLPDLLQALRRMTFDGFGVTHPFKTAILAHLDDIAPDAAAMGAVNTVAVREGRMIGHNTDWLGFAAQYRAVQSAGADGGPVLVLGAGGAGRAVLYALKKAGVSDIRLHDPDIALADKLARGDEKVTVVGDPRDAAGEVVGIVNASTIGMHGKGGLPLEADAIRPHHWVADVVYFPVETPLINFARSLGCRVATGDIMCLEQALAGFEIMTGLAPDRAAMTARFAELLSAAA